MTNFDNDAFEHDEWTKQFIKNDRERRSIKLNSPNQNDATDFTAVSENFLDEAASAIDLKSQLVSKNILSDDKNNISNITKDGNNTETDSVLKKLKFPCYKVAKKVTNAEKLKTKARLKSK